jgi:hypothetical protein
LFALQYTEGNFRNTGRATLRSLRIDSPDGKSGWGLPDGIDLAVGESFPVPKLAAFPHGFTRFMAHHADSDEALVAPLG